MNILGISCYYHDSAACLLKNGGVIAAAEEERFTRKKHDNNFPKKSISYCLKEGGIDIKDIDIVAFYEKPLLKLDRILQMSLETYPKSFLNFYKILPGWLTSKLKVPSKLKKKLNYNGKVFFIEHHHSHAASAFFASPFNEATIVTIDGVGEWSTISIHHGKSNKIETLKEIYFPNSLGLLYSTITAYLGFKVLNDEYKVMGLAAYGKPSYYEKFKEKLIDIKDDGSFSLNMDYFSYTHREQMFSKEFEKEFGQRRNPGEAIEERHKDIAASLQKLTEEIVLLIANHAYKLTNSKNLCMAGGVALNCVANGKILKNKIFENIWIQPAAGDAGGSLGAALAYWHKELGQPRDIFKDQMKGSYLGPSFNEKEIETELKLLKANYKKINSENLIEIIANELSKEKTIGWFQGKMEFGPRALGGRSIIADPRSEKMQKELNLKVKFRESFRPFAPSILIEDVSDWFDLKKESPYMLLVADVKKELQIQMSKEDQTLFGIDKLNIKRSSIPAVTHVDYSARVQTVHKETNPRYHNLLKKFKEITGCPVLVNTSFNVRGEPIVCSIKDAFNCFMGTNLDILVCENFILYKNDQDNSLKKNYQMEFDPD